MEEIKKNSNFITEIIEKDLASDKDQERVHTRRSEGRQARHAQGGEVGAHRHDQGTGREESEDI